MSQDTVHRPEGDGFSAGEGLAARAGYRFFQTLAWLACKVLFRLSVEGKENIPETGAFVLAPVHRSYLDTPMLSWCPRRLRFMGKDSMWKNRASAWFLSSMGGFPVSRDQADREALQTTIEVIDRGEPAVLFAEGERKRGPRIYPLKDGAVYVAARCGVPIVPVGIGGSEAAMPKGRNMIHPVKVHMVVGKPIPAPPKKESGRISRKAVQQTSLELRETLQELFDRAQVRCGNRNVYDPAVEPPPMD
ncbi:MAG: 1-acyl-sn-glycerol-3-phosphate acyltransferase [Actinomycetia bacterium]|nr:1-acyl-sn-glycerol-3-phosphate acyltransferase [Actinomycetes bacterium]MCP4963102.1 1-acyl-sn-glycerol-3-phosphate acyltransferase [Actinomycetes bacterium]